MIGGAANSVRGSKYADTVRLRSTSRTFFDLAFGEPMAMVGTADYAGRVRVIYGSSTGLKSAPSQNISEDSTGMPGAAEYNDDFGSDVTSADFNADGYADLAIVADNEFVSGAGLGSVTVVLGAETGLSSTAFALSFPVNEMLYGPPQTGDLNRDGIPDLVLNTVEAPYVLSGSTSLATSHSMRRLSPPDTEQLNVQAALVGDVNGDGWPDITTPYISALTDWKTALAVYFGSAAGLQPPQRGFGDVDGDGKADVLTGGVGEDIGTTADTGSVWIVYGGDRALDSDHDPMFSQATAGVPGTATTNGAFGENVGLLDLTKDGRLDPLIVARHDQGIVLLAGAADGATTTGAREIKPVGDTGDYRLPISG